jgi:cell fate (sporulation/competence/biofilm development) regulator YmcA (YheA/YmcA/DUF963 family)
MKLLGITDSINVCECCGKSDLKSTVAFQTDAGDVVYYGKICASKHSHKSAKEINKELKSIKTIARQEAKEELINHPVYKEYRKTLDSIPSNTKFYDRLELIKDVSAARDALEKELIKKYNEKYMLKDLLFIL